MNESQFTQSIHRLIDKSKYRAWKINDNFAGGVPDAFYRAKTPPQNPLWVEYKFIKRLPKRGTTLIVPDLSRQQLEWLKEAHSSGENVWVAIGYERGVYIMSEPEEWENGTSTDNFVANLTSKADFVNTIYLQLAKKQ